MLAGEAPRAHVSLREDRNEIEIVAGPFHVPASTSASDHMHHGEDDGTKSPLVVFPWPAESGMTGFRMALYDADGSPLPRSAVHHVLGINFSRRQLLYPAPERFFGFGTETPDVKLPEFLEVPIGRGDSIAFYAAWSNTTGSDLHGVHLQIVLAYAGGDDDREQALPIYFDTSRNPDGSNSFDLPPGRSERAHEFVLPVGGGLLLATGHLHDYGTELRLEDTRTGEVIITIYPKTEAGGRVTGMERKVYRRFFNLLDARLRLEAGVAYRVVGVYDNPTGKAILDGGMAHMVGLFVPDDMAAWPRRDPADSSYQHDVATLPRPIDGAHVHH
jgi:hypothetical protein